jgi:Tol biopolymer transport system component/DNA-binding winged helix-turn-helix (wHTH) protein
MTNDDSAVFLFDDIEVEPRTFKVFKAGLPVQLEPKTLNLLIFLIENRGRLVEKGEMLDAVWKDTVVTENALTREVAKVRKSLGDDSRTPKYIRTVHTRGYQFIAKVEVKNGELKNGGGEVRQINTVARGNDFQNAPASTTPVPPAPYFVDANSGSRRLLFRRTLSAAAIVSALLLASLLVWKVTRLPAAPQATTILEITAITTAPGLDLNPTFSPDGNYLAYSSDRSGSFEIYAKTIATGGREIHLTSDGDQNMEPAWSPDGEFIAYHSVKRGGIWLVPALGGTAKQLTEFGCRPAWSRDGSMIAFQSEGFHDLIQPYASSATIWVVGARGGAPGQITHTGNPAGGHLFPSWSADGKRIAFLNADIRSMQIWSVSAGGDQLKRLTAVGTGDKADVVYSPDGESIFFTAGMMLFRLRVEPATGDPVGEPVKVADLGSILFRHPTVSADGKRIAYSAWTARSNIWSLPISPRTHEATGSPVALTNELHSRNGLTTFSPDGQKIAFTSERRGIGYQLWMMDRDGKNQTQLTTDPQGAGFPNWYSSGDKIAFYCVRRGRTTLSSIELESRKESVLSDFEELECPRLSPDTKQVAFTYAPNNFFNIGIMAARGGEPRQLTFESTFTGFPCWSPDGKLLAFQMKRADAMQVMMIASSGGTPTQLTSGASDRWPYSWSPDGDKITFASSRNGVWNIGWVSRSDKIEKQLTVNTNPGAVIRFPDWSPLGDQIIYEQADIAGNIYVMSLK